MKSNLMKALPLLEKEQGKDTCKVNRPARKARVSQIRAIEKRIILLISEDTRLYENLRRLAKLVGKIVVRVGKLSGVGLFLQLLKPKAVLLDLDLPDHAAWKMADALLKEQSCPPMVLLTSRRPQFDTETANCTGSLVDKSDDSSHLLEVVEKASSMSESGQNERNAIQRVLIQWLKPCKWPIPFTPANRFWGINE
jgi:FixJ family two-component response regulator